MPKITILIIIVCFCAITEVDNNAAKTYEKMLKMLHLQFGIVKLV